MKIHLAVYRAISGDDHRYERFVSDVEKHGGVKDWSATQKFAIGDLALFYFGDPMMSIAAIGVVASELRTCKGRWDWTNRKQTTFCDFAPIWLLTRPIPLKEAAYHTGLQTWYRTSPYRHSRELEPEVAQKLITEISNNNPDFQKRFSKLGIEVSKRSKAQKAKSHRSSLEFPEGGIREITVELQKRNPELRKQAIAIFGESCRVCGFNFGDFYGELGAGYIEVHHLKPLSKRKAERKTTIEDVDVVCANCHRVLHRNGRKPLPLDELRKAIRRRK